MEKAQAVAFTLLLCKLNRFNVCLHDDDIDIRSLLSCLAFCFTLAQQDTCGPIGNSDVTAATPSRARRFYLNSADPAPCTGNITSWRVCYYGPDDVDDDRGTYWATYAVYIRWPRRTLFSRLSAIPNRRDIASEGSKPSFVNSR